MDVFYLSYSKGKNSALRFATTSIFGYYFFKGDSSYKIQTIENEVWVTKIWRVGLGQKFGVAF